jgi:hypothetical protein
MTISTYAELQAAILKTMKRTSTDIDNVADFITLAEAEFNRRVKTDDMVVVTTLALSGGEIAYPTSPRMITPKSVVLTSSPTQPLTFVRGEQIEHDYPDATGGRPAVYTIRDGKIVVRPSSSDDLVLTYYGAIPALSDSATSNWLLASHPDLYLYRSLYHGLIDIADDARAGLAKSVSDELIAEINRFGQGQSYGATVASRPMRSPP